MGSASSDGQGQATATLLLAWLKIRIQCWVSLKPREACPVDSWAARSWSHTRTEQDTQSSRMRSCPNTPRKVKGSLQSSQLRPNPLKMRTAAKVERRWVSSRVKHVPAGIPPQSIHTGRGPTHTEGAWKPRASKAREAAEPGAPPTSPGPAPRGPTARRERAARDAGAREPKAAPRARPAPLTSRLSTLMGSRQRRRTGSSAGSTSRLGSFRTGRC